MKRFKIAFPQMLCLGLFIGFWGCALTPPPELEYFVKTDAVLPDGEVYYIDPVDSTVVWNQEGVQVKVKFYNDEMLDARFPEYSPYTLKGVVVPELGYPPPLWTAFEITVINRTRERVELDPTQLMIRLDNGQHYYCRQGVGGWRDGEEYFNYSYLKWGSRAGNIHYHASFERNDIWRKTEFLREKPVRKGKKYVGIVTFPPLPPETKSFTLEVNNFILGFDRFQVGYGNPVEFTDLVFEFKVDQGVVEVSEQ
ncbi:MAG: hypothetical protein HOC74_41480 [Gemmatimonadetes bacterium]|nr:hypothetical protein [Gemmatimonadota bacterium]